MKVILYKKKHTEKNLICIWVDEKIDRNCCTENLQEKMVIFLSPGETPITGVTSFILVKEVVNVLEQFNNVTNTSINTGCKADLEITLKKKFTHIWLLTTSE